MQDIHICPYLYMNHAKRLFCHTSHHTTTQKKTKQAEQNNA